MAEIWSCRITFTPAATTTRYVVYQDNVYGAAYSNEIILKKSIDGGNTWTNTRLTTNSGNSQAPRVAVDGNNVYVVYQDDVYGNNEIILKKSIDGGNTWTNTRLTTNSGNSQAPDIAVNGNNVYVVYQDDVYGPAYSNEIILKKSIDGGSTWTNVRLTTNSGNSQAPKIAVSGSNVYVVYQDDVYGRYSNEIILKKSTIAAAPGRTYGSPRTAATPRLRRSHIRGSKVYVVYQDDV